MSFQRESDTLDSVYERLVDKVATAVMKKLKGDDMESRPIFDSSDPVERWRVLDILRGAGFFVSGEDDSVVLLGADATDDNATSAGNLLLDKGFSEGICW